MITARRANCGRFHPAVPHATVAGLGTAVALLLEMDPTLTTRRAREILRSSARSDGFTGTTPNNRWGYGKLDVFEAANQLGLQAQLSGVVEFVLESVSVSEGEESIDLEVTRIGGNSGAASVNYAVTGGDAEAATDFELAAGTLTWADDDSAVKTISLGIIDDDLDEADETIDIELSSPSGVGLGGVTVLTVTVTDDDEAAAPTPPPAPPPPPSNTGGGGGGGAVGLFVLLALTMLLALRGRASGRFVSYCLSRE